MNGHCINIAISGLGLKSSDELKIELRNAIPDQYGINWINAADPNIDLLLINESFFETDSIQKILKSKIGTIVFLEKLYLAIQILCLQK